MKIKNYIDHLFDLSVVFSFDRSGFKRHCPEKLQEVDLSSLHGIVTGASSGIGQATAKALIGQGMDCLLISRNAQKLEESFKSETYFRPPFFRSLDMADLKSVFQFAKQDVKGAVDLIVHNAGGMPNSLQMTRDGFEEMFASQVLGPFILTKSLADSGKLQKGCRVIFVSSGGMYLQKLDLSDLSFKNKQYNKYTGYANAKRAQVVLNELFSRKYPDYLFSAMHPGWVDTPGVRDSMPLFRKILSNRLRTSEEGADTILWLATRQDYPSGKFWFDRKQVKTSVFHLNKSTPEEEEKLWSYCESVFNSVSHLCINQ